MQPLWLYKCCIDREGWKVMQQKPQEMYNDHFQAKINAEISNLKNGINMVHTV